MAARPSPRRKAPQKPLPEADEEHSTDLTAAEREEVDKRKAPPARVVHEIVRLQGLEELKRPVASLLGSGFAAGVSIWISLIAQSALMLKVPESPWRQMIVDLGYSAGFVIVILGQLQLFTESTITAVIPLATDISLANLGRTLRLWATVLFANLAGTFAVALLLPAVGIASHEQLTAMIAISKEATALGPGDAFLRGIPAGFMLATIAWVLPSTKGQEIWVVTLLTWLIALAGFSHVVAGSAEAWLLVTTGGTSVGQALAGFILPVLAGNMIGGTGLFAVIAHAQVRSEL